MRPVAGLVLLMALGLGVAADRLLWEGPIGPGPAVWVALLGAAATALAYHRGWAWKRVTLAWSGVAAAAAAGTAWRASPVLQLLFLGVVAVAASVVLLEARRHRLGRTRVLDHAWGLLLVPWRAGLGAAPMMAGLELPAAPERRRAVALGRGLLLAIPPVTVFALLFIAADPAFERVAIRLTSGMELLPPHLFLTVGFGWIAAGLLGGLLPGPDRNPLDALRPPRIGVEETAMVLGLVSALFAVFVALQFTYLFGGLTQLQAEEGLTLAEYARRGFFELVAVAGLVLALLLAMGASSTRGAGRRMFRALSAVLIALVMVVIASAALRLRLYVLEFGLTDARLFAAAVMAWITVTLGLYAMTVLRGRSRPFATSALLAGLATIVGLAALNPDALVARTNLQRADVRPVDTTYLRSLSADAVPVLVAGLDTLDPASACELADAIRLRWADDHDPGGWRSWNAAEATARQLAAEVPACRRGRG